MQLKAESSKFKVFISCILWIVSCGLFFGGCVYVGPSILPSYIKKININTFANESFRPDLDEKITSAVTREFIADGRLITTGEDESDAILFGEIKRYALEPLSYTEKMNVEEYKVRIIINIWLKDLKQNKILWREDNIESWAAASSTQGGLEIKVENEAINEVVEKLARKVVKRVIDGWSNI
ncbi:hypothetical protein AUJ66_02745 [Candidatus Desantisbacteria bacterium CG1_02_38_46]|uniref:DUF4136 domain-containing protein n=3 Tax=unclassified Candidatus Desantisiibacteriota TaxID=3106372 RepID=A0A2H9P9N7_9BACT|nr:MAG: hypothetical protein AUJ66_02745 [Candidatus Desantisbacteria bacterium CG1_02_38_46]PIU51943.1 MAG: hypothetical protein COS91_01785 [Candidatus Desantisbacteria bacterium CG07_land_8_20_14_0_80_39_15]PIZ14981.1 MAG: hypothetical protein COY51_06730 [Candidatus Desantisbacteria bacterium CG_4_10_14_0_8_um_filter_39_17]